MRRASDLVGYRLYLDLVGSLAKGKSLHAFELGEEEARVRHALELAAEGRQVALVCSGDPGIYAMASPLFELIERGRAGRLESHRDCRLPWAVRPAGGGGADRCAPRPRLLRCFLERSHDPLAGHRATPRSGRGRDFVVALYNPVSGRRRHQLVRAVEILGQHRSADTPVVLARKLGRPGEAVSVIDLQELTPERVDMLTLVLVGSSETRRVATGQGLWVYTPRGYGTREDKAQEASG